ncbi:abortive infection family protein [Methanobrevibacter thaueri]|uniref:abortive infection family protein n=1 Tax=Methanobrevibacter thaueri TaxID=190975 RepID=UPI00386C40C6
MIKNLKLKSLELGKLIVKNEIHIDWYNILDAFEFLYVFDSHPRLIRSQNWGDPDYDDCVIGVIFDSLSDDKLRACDMIEYILKNCTGIEELEITKIMSDFRGDEPYLNTNRTTDEEIKDLIEHINQSVSSGKLVFALDRLHTLMTKYVKELCVIHSIPFDENERLDVIFKSYVNYIKEYIDSDMSLTILKSNISLFSQFNNIRNNYTYAHDNNVLDDAESKLIFKNIVNVKEFVDDLEECIFN